MKKIMYALLYSTPALIFGGVSLNFLIQYVSEFSYTINNPYIGFLGTIGQILLPLIFLYLSCLYIFYAIKQDYINKYTNWSMLSWYAGVAVFVVVGITLGTIGQTKFGESGAAQAWASLAIAAYSLFAAAFSVVCAHVVGLVRGSLRPKILNLVFIILVVLIIVINITDRLTPFVPPSQLPMEFPLGN